MHNLHKIDPKKRMGTCNECGRVRVYKTHNKRGALSWRCSVMVRMSGRAKFYGIREIEIERMRKKQRNRCAICKRPFKRTPSIDHCHKSKRVRGLLCHCCNVGLGMFQDNPQRLRQAARYLKRC